jgi:ribosomal protein S11
MAKKKKNKQSKTMLKKDKGVKKKKSRLSSPKVKVIVNSSFNNTIVTITDYEGNAVTTSTEEVLDLKVPEKVQHSHQLEPDKTQQLKQ